MLRLASSSLSQRLTNASASARGCFSTLPRFDEIDFSITDGVATVELNRPHRLNALSLKMGDELLTLQDYLKSDAARSEARVVVVTGSGDKSFRCDPALLSTPALICCRFSSAALGEI